MFFGDCSLLGSLPFGCFLCFVRAGFFLAFCGVMVCFLVLSLSRHFGGSPLEYILLPYLSKKKKKGRKREKKLKFVSRQ